MLDMYDFNNDIWLCHSFGGQCYNITAYVSSKTQTKIQNFDFIIIHKLSISMFWSSRHPRSMCYEKSKSFWKQIHQKSSQSSSKITFLPQMDYQRFSPHLVSTNTSFRWIGCLKTAKIGRRLQIWWSRIND